MKPSELATGVLPKDLPGDLSIVADVVGVENTIKLALAFRGSHIYFRNVDFLNRVHRNKVICKEYTSGMKVVELARKYNLSTRQIENVLSS